MGHYYFGTLNRPQGPYFWVLLESSAEFLSIKALREISGDAAADRYIARLQSAIDTQDKPLPAFDAIDSNSGSGRDVSLRLCAPCCCSRWRSRWAKRRCRPSCAGCWPRRRRGTGPELQGIALKAGIDAKAWEHWRASCVAGGTQRCQ
jgi:hypothetical protein